jgi:hypothetical protein
MRYLWYVERVRGGVSVLHEPYGKPVLASKNAHIGAFVDKTMRGRRASVKNISS